MAGSVPAGRGRQGPLGWQHAIETSERDDSNGFQIHGIGFQMAWMSILSVPLALPRVNTRLFGLPTINRLARMFLASLILAHGAWATAQTLPAPSRTVYKCEVNGKVVYSDEPCLGAKKVDVEPTRGLDKSSGRSRVGNDVQRERQREAMASALQPITGMDSKQFDRAGRRNQLPVESQRACKQLDQEIPSLEVQEAATVGPDKQRIQESLLRARSKFRELRCD
jgi:hypothetical protein